MEVSVLGVGLHPHLLLPRSLPFPSTSSSSSYLSLKPNSSRLSFSAQTATPFVGEQPPSDSRTTARRAPHSNSYSARQSAISELQRSSDLPSALSRLESVLQVQDLNTVLRYFGTRKRWSELSQIFYWMKQNGKTSPPSYSTYIKFMGESFNPVEALETYNGIEDESTKTNIVVCNSVLSSLVKNRKFDSSIKLFSQMKRDGLTPDIITFSTLLAGCIKSKQSYSKASELVQELQRSGLQMDGVIYGTLLAICASNNKLEEAESYFNQMKNEGHLPNLFHYSSLLNAYSVSGDYKKAETLVQDIKSAGLVPNKVMLTTLLKVYVRGGLFEKSRELLAELEALGYAEDEMPYCLLMDSLSKAKRIDEAKLVFEEMKTKGVKSEDSNADGYAYSIMISAFCRGSLLEDAKQLAKDFESTYDKYDLVMLNTMLCAYCRAGDMASVMEMLKKMDELAISPDRHTFHILIKYFCKEKMYLLAYRVTMDMHNKGHEVEEELCSSLMFHLGKMKAHGEAFSVYNLLRYSKSTMCKALHEKILHILIDGGLLKDAYVVVKDNGDLISVPVRKKFASTFMKSGNINLINDVMKVVHGFGGKIDQEIFGTAITRYIMNPEKKDLLIQLMQWMSGHGYAVDSPTRNLILKNSHLFGRQVIAEILSKQQMMSKPLKSNRSRR